jgi:hypothetical protein
MDLINVEGGSYFNKERRENVCHKNYCSRDVLLVTALQNIGGSTAFEIEQSVFIHVTGNLTNTQE